MKVNGVIRGFNLADVTSIVIKGRGGNDRIALDQSMLP